MNQIRTFIAVEIPSVIKEKISELQEKLKKDQARVSWVKPNNIHITLKFLGNVDESKITDIERAIENAVNQIKPFSTEVVSVGVFPNYKKPRVIWIAAKSEKDLLKLLAQQIDNELHKLGFEKESRSFEPHLTIGRVKMHGGIRGIIRKLEQNVDFNAGIFTVKEIIVMRSDLKPTGAVYTPLKRIIIQK